MIPCLSPWHPTPPLGKCHALEYIIAFQDVDEEVVQKNNVKWIVHRGAPPSIAALEQILADVKVLYTDKFGEDVDGEEFQKDDIQWIVQRGDVLTVLSSNAKHQASDADLWSFTLADDEMAKLGAIAKSDTVIV